MGKVFSASLLPLQGSTVGRRAGRAGRGAVLNGGTSEEDIISGLG